MTSPIGAEIAGRVLDLVGNRAEAQVTATSGRHSLTRFANSFIHQNVAEEVRHVSLKIAAGGRVASATTTRTDASGLERLVEAALAAARLRPVDPDWPGLASPQAPVAVDHYDAATDDASPDMRAERVAAFVGAGPGLAAAGYCDTDGNHVAFANSAGQAAEGRYSRATLDGIHQTDDSAGSAHHTAAALAEIDASAAGTEAARRARDSRRATELEPGDYEVVLEPECVATMLIFLGAYGFNAKQVIEGQSAIEVGKAQFDPVVDITDDPVDPRAIGLTFDWDGTPRHRLELVRAGASAALAHDRRTAAKLGTTSTGHAYPGSETWGPFPGNLFMAPGNASREELIAPVRRGLLVTTFNYCRVLDPRTQVTTGLTRNGTFLVEDGEVRGGVANLRFTQSFLEALGPGNVLGVGSAARFADSEFGTGMIHCPAVRLASFRFTGGARG
ncbi:MAG: TldD/PmbA family protein [Acidimicrobiia bacterium]